jgi:hypothetical protein
MPSLDINTILGTTWFALCSHKFVHACRAGIEQIRGPRRISPPESVKFLFWSTFTFYYLLNPVGIVASISLFFSGSSWSRWLIGLVAGVELFTNIIVASGKFRTTKNYVFATVSFISLLLLFSTVAQYLLNIKP